MRISGLGSAISPAELDNVFRLPHLSRAAQRQCVCKYPDKGKDALVLQIEFEGESRIVFTGSKVLIDQITQVVNDDFPFKASIVKNGEQYKFR